MAIIVVCSGCQQRFGAAPQNAGHSMPCPQCGTTIQIPRANEPAAARPKAPVSAPTGSAMVVTCARCQQQFSAPPELLGRQVPCPMCQAPIQVGGQQPISRSVPAADPFAADPFKADPFATSAPANAPRPGVVATSAGNSEHRLLIILGSVVGGVVGLLLIVIVARSFLSGDKPAVVAQGETVPPRVVAPASPEVPPVFAPKPPEVPQPSAPQPDNKPPKRAIDDVLRFQAEQIEERKREREAAEKAEAEKAAAEQSTRPAVTSPNGRPSAPPGKIDL